MPRRRRINAPGIHHVYSRGNGGQRTFLCRQDATDFLRLLRWIAGDEGWRILTYCLMPNHYHVVVEIPEPNLGAGMHRLASRYARIFHDRHGSHGRLTQAPFGSRLVADDRYVAHLLRYVALNPVKAKLCRRPEDWPYSAHRTLLEGSSDGLVEWARTWELLEPWGGIPATRYGALFDEHGVHGPWSTAFELEPPRPSLTELLQGADLDAALHDARWTHGYRLRELAAATGLSVSTLSRRTKRR